MFEILTGQTHEHVIQLSGSSKSIHREMVTSWNDLVTKAQHQGFEPLIVSGFRDFAAQLTIWNAKASGQRVVLDSTSQPVDVLSLSPRDRVLAILRWSALPGASRHHWGTDIDVIDARALTPGYQVQLVTEEFVGVGPFAALHEWLDGAMAEFGFFRPYAEDRGGVAPERWHLSYAPLANQYDERYTEAVLVRAIETVSIKLKQTLLAMSEEIYARFVKNISPSQLR